MRGFQRRREEMHRLQKELDTVKEELQEMQLTVRPSIIGPVAVVAVVVFFYCAHSRH